jgi:hypothetical protein
MTPAAQLDGFIDKFSDDIAAQTRACLAALRARMPGAAQLVYDNYNALAIGFAPRDKTSEVIISLAVYPRWLSLFFLAGQALPDPSRRLAGSGNQVRHIRLTGPGDLEDPAVSALIDAALAMAVAPIAPDADAALIIKSISARQRPRRP